MPSQLDKEIIGDWNNLKGTHYHLVFALWLILRRQATRVEFYKGNDLLAHSASALEAIVPPAPHDDLISETASTMSLHSKSGEEDLWIQLKATKAKWTVSELFKENLLINFIHNALESNKQNRTWKAWLVSQGEIDSKEIDEFIASPYRHRNKNTRFNQIVDTIHKEIVKVNPHLTNFRPKIIEIAFSILKQISETEPIPLEVLQSQIDTELTLAVPDRETVQQIGSLLLGAMIEDSAAGPKAAHAYDAEWINSVAQRPLIRSDLLDKSIGAACDAAVQRAATQLGFNLDYSVSREAFESMFKRYLSSNETCFILLGTSGAGKSWVSANAAIPILENKSRLLIRGIDFDAEKRLANLVAEELKRFSSSGWSDEQFLQKLKATARTDGQPSFVIFLDDLSPTSDDVESYRRNFQRLVRECKDAGAKLVVTCQQHVWNFLRLGEWIDQSEIFTTADDNRSKNSVPKMSDSSDLSPPINDYSVGWTSNHLPSKHSFILSDFSPEEMEKAVRLRLPEKSAEAVVNQLRAPAFLALRKPYFLIRYIEKNYADLIKNATVPSVDIDELLDWSEQSAIIKATLELYLSENDLMPALTNLVENLWKNRPNGIRYADALNICKNEVGDNAGELVNVWRKSGFLTVEGNINFAESLVADRIFAKFVEHKSVESNYEYLTELDPQKDFGTVVAYLRQMREPAVAAEKLIRINPKWTSAVVAGLAQARTVDWRILGVLSALLAEHQYSDLSGEIYDALGQLAARSKRAYKWVSEMYLGDRARTWHRGAYAFISTAEYEPRRVEKAVRTRLMRLVGINREFFDKDKRKEWILSNALIPFRNINNLSAARIGQRLINRYNFLISSDEEDNRRRDWHFIDEADEIRGRIAIFDEAEFTRLLADSENDNVVVRYRAAQALIRLAIVQPDTVKDTLCQRIEIENDAATLKRLLIAAYHLIEKFPDELLSALNRSRISKFVEGFRVTDGLAFELLGNLAAKNPQQVAELLPPSLEPREPDVQALLGEMFVYVWWRLNECSEDTINYAPFEIFDALDLSAVTEKIRPFALRSRSVSLLARMCLELNISSFELTGRQSFYPNLNKDFLYIDFGDFLKKHLSVLRNHESFKHFQELLLECVRQSDPVNIYPLSRLRKAVATCGGSCLALLTDIAAAMLDPVPLLDELPHGWQAIRVISDLLEIGKSDKSIIDFAKQVLSEQKHESTIQADAESRRLLAQLGLLENNPHQSLREQREAANRLSLFSDLSNAHGITVFTTENPDKFLEYLDTSILKTDDILTLYALADEARNWQALLTARVYARVVSERPVKIEEARDLCEQMLTAVRTMSPSAVKDEYETVYESILSLLDDQDLNVPIHFSLNEKSSENIIGKSHRLSIEILNLLISTPARQKTGPWLEELLYNRRWWEESDRFLFKDSLLIQGHGVYEIYFFPAVRLALIIAGWQVKEADPAARIMRERREIHKLLSKHEYLLDQANLTSYDEEMLRCVFEDLDMAAQKSPRDERVENLHGGVLLRLNRLAEAEEAFKESLALPTSAGGFRAGTLYDLACVFARQNRPNDCRHALIESAKLKPLNKKWLAEDADLKSVAGEVWFQELLVDYTD